MPEGWNTGLVETACYGCVIRLVWFFGDSDPRWNWVEVQVISNHRQRDHMRWRSRIRNAWAVLRNRYDWSGLQLDTEEEALAFSKALEAAISETWPSAEPP